MSEPLNRAELSKVPRVVWVVVIGIVLALAGIIGFSAYFVTSPGPPLRLVSVSYSPENPEPGDIITVEAVGEGGSYANSFGLSLSYASYFAGAEAGGKGTGGFGTGRAVWEIGPFPNGTEVWFVVSVSTRTEGPIVSDDFILQIGEVVRGGPSGLRFEQVTQTPTVVTSLDNPFVTARVNGSANIAQVQLVGFQFSLRGGNARTGYILETGPGTYTGDLFSSPGPGGFGFERGTMHRYRLAAIDVTGNTAVTETFSFVVT